MQFVQITDTEEHTHFINPTRIVWLREYNSDSVTHGTLIVLDSGGDATRLVTAENIFNVRDTINRALGAGLP